MPLPFCHTLAAIMDSVGMMIGSGMGVLIIDAARDPTLYISGIIVAACNVCFVAVVIYRLFCVGGASLDNDASTVSALMKRATGWRRLPLAFAIMTSVVYTAGGVAVLKGALAMVGMQAYLAVVHAALCLLYWFTPRIVDGFLLLSSVIEVGRLALIIAVILNSAAGIGHGAASKGPSFYEVRAAAFSPSIMGTVLSSTFAFAGFETSQRGVALLGSNGVLFTFIVSIVVTVAFYLGMFNAASHAFGMGDVVRLYEGNPGGLVADLTTRVLPKWMPGYSYWHEVCGLVSFFSIVNGAVACVRYSAELLEDTSRERGVYLWRILRAQGGRHPAAAAIIPLGFAFTLNGDLVRLFGMMFISMFLMVSASLISVASSKRKLVDFVFASISFVFSTLLLVLELSDGGTQLFSIAACVCILCWVAVPADEVEKSE